MAESPELIAALRALAGVWGGLYRGDLDEELVDVMIERGLATTIQVPVATVPRLFLTVRGRDELQRAGAKGEG